MNSETETIAALQAENEALRKRVVELEQDNEQLRLLVEHMPVIIDAIDTNGQITYWNQECERVTGYSANEIVGNPKAFELLYPNPDYRAKLFGEWGNQVESGHDWEFNMLAKDGTNKVILWRSVAHRHPIPGDKAWYVGVDITAPKRMGEQLLQSQMLLQNLIDNSLSIIFAKDTEWNLTLVNRQYANLLGLEPEEILGKNEYDLFPAESMNAIRANDQHVMETKQPMSFEETLEAEDGTHTYISNKFPLYNADGTIYGVGSITMDITERKRIENELYAFKTLVERAPDGIALGSLDGRVTYANDAFGAITGYGEATIGMSVSAFHAAEEMDQVGASIQRAIQGEIWSGEMQYLQPDGTLVPTLISVFRIADEAGTIQGLAAIVRDMTEQQRQNEALRNSEERLWKIIEKIPIGICITNEQYCFEYVNPAYCAIYKYTTEELLGQPFTMVVPEDYRPTAIELHDTFMHESQEIPNEWDVFAKGGEPRNILADAAAIIGEDGQPKKVTFVVDITNLKQAQREQQRLQEQIIDAQRADIRELSTPLIPLSDTVMLMPLIGTIDSNRAQMVMEALLEGIAQYQSDVAILDITGVSVVDTQVANALIQSAQAVRLLGARVILTGIGPAMAQTLVHLGVDLSSLETRGSLQSAVVEALLRNDAKGVG